MSKRSPNPTNPTSAAAATAAPDSSTMNTRELRQAVVAFCAGHERSMEQILQHLARKPGQADRVSVAVYDMVRLGKMVNLSIVNGARVCKKGRFLAHEAKLDGMAAHRLNFGPLLAAWLGPRHAQPLAGSGASA